VTIVALGRTIHLFVTRFTGLVTEVLVDFNLGRLAFMALGAVAGKFFLVSFVVEGHGAFFVVIGVAVCGDSNVGTYEREKHHHDYQFLHFLPPFLRLVLLGVIASNLLYSFYLKITWKSSDIEQYVDRCRS